MYRAKVYVTDATTKSGRSKLPKEFVSDSDNPKDILTQMADFAGKLKPGLAAKVNRISIDLDTVAEAENPFDGLK